MILAQLSNFEGPSIDWLPLTPQIILVVAALVILLVTSLSPAKVSDSFSTAVTVGSGVAAGVVAWFVWNDIRDEGPSSTVAGAVGVDGFSIFFTILTLSALVATSLVGHSYIKREQMAAPEFSALLLLTAVGAIVMASANDLIVLFIGLEALSIGLYVMAAMQFRRREAQEAAMKYFVLGAFSSAFFLYGIALVYGATGSTNLVNIAAYFNTIGSRINNLELFYVGMALMLVGLAFKVAAAPFHFWAPDVYQGSPSPVSGYMASAAKAAGFAAMLRIFFVAFSRTSADWTPIVAVLSAITLIVGAVMAITQNDVKRMLAFSSVGHAGYVLVAVQAATSDGTSAALFYLFTYTFMVIGSFAVVSLLGWNDGHDVSRYEGLARRRPLIAVAFTVFLLGQAGVPFTSGFVGKFLVIRSAVDDEIYWLAVLAMVVSVITAFMYLRIISNMWDREVDVADAPRLSVPLTTGFVVVVCAMITVVYGVIPQSLIEFARDAVPVLVAGG
ncbi:MAG: NADH-quinone oxidoreductase subunit N [Actinobacteria bacterium]|nr:NADH-quinone oxidoreductase subunit N [Actinomycetota bacterium]